MPADYYPLQVLLLALSGWVNRVQQRTIDYLVEENQAVWAESRTRQPMLTTGERCVPDFSRKLNTSLPMKKTIYQYNPAARTGFGPYYQFAFHPITRYN